MVQIYFYFTVINVKLLIGNAIVFLSIKMPFLIYCEVLKAYFPMAFRSQYILSKVQYILWVWISTLTIIG